jgi:hypothetical protein
MDVLVRKPECLEGILAFLSKAMSPREKNELKSKDEIPHLKA